MMIGLRPILSDSQPKNTKKPVPSRRRCRDHDVGRLPVDLQHVLQEEQRIELAGIPDDGLTDDRAEQGEKRDLGVLPLTEGFGQRRLRALAFFLHLLEGGRFVQLQTDPDGNRRAG